MVCLSHHVRLGGITAVGSLLVVFMVGRCVLALLDELAPVADGMRVPSCGCPVGQCAGTQCGW